MATRPPLTLDLTAARQRAQSAATPTASTMNPHQEHHSTTGSMLVPMSPAIGPMLTARRRTTPLTVSKGWASAGPVLCCAMLGMQLLNVHFLARTNHDRPLLMLGLVLWALVIAWCLHAARYGNVCSSPTCISLRLLLLSSCSSHRLGRDMDSTAALESMPKPNHLLFQGSTVEFLSKSNPTSLRSALSFCNRCSHYRPLGMRHCR